MSEGLSWNSICIELKLHLYWAETPSVLSWSTICIELKLHLYWAEAPSILSWSTICTELKHHLYWAEAPSILSWSTICIELKHHLYWAEAPSVLSWSSVCIELKLRLYWAEAPSVFSSSIIFLFYFYIIPPFVNFYNKTCFVHFLFPGYLLNMNCSSDSESFVVKTWGCQVWDLYADNCWKYTDSQKIVAAWSSLCQVFTPIISWACVW